MTDYRVKVTVRNNNILERIEALGFESAKKFCDANKISYSPTIALISMHTRGRKIDGEWSKMAMDLSSALHCEPEDLFSEVQEVGLKTNVSEMIMSEDAIRRMLSAPDQPDRMIGEKVQKLLVDSGTSERNAKIFHDIEFTDATSEDVGNEHDISSMRARQIHERQIKTLRKPNRLKALTLIIDDNRLNEAVHQNEDWDSEQNKKEMDDHFELLRKKEKIKRAEKELSDRLTKKRRKARLDAERQRIQRSNAAHPVYYPPPDEPPIRVRFSEARCPHCGWIDGHPEGCPSNSAEIQRILKKYEREML